MQTTDEQIGYLDFLPVVYQFIIRNLLASNLPNVFQRNERVISNNLDTRHPLVSTIHGLKTMACQSNESYCSVIIADVLQIATEIRHTLVPLSKRGGVPTFTVDRTLYCKSIHSFCCIFPQPVSHLLTRSVTSVLNHSFTD